MPTLRSPRVTRLQLKRLDEIGDALELMDFEFRGTTREADDLLGLMACHGRTIQSFYYR